MYEANRFEDTSEYMQIPIDDQIIHVLWQRNMFALNVHNSNRSQILFNMQTAFLRYEV